MTLRRGYKVIVLLLFSFGFIATFFAFSGKTAYVPPKKINFEPSARPSGTVTSTVKTGGSVLGESVITPGKTTPATTSVSSITLTNNKSISGIYTGPGAVSTHTDFEKWLGKPVPYATDYIDYKGGWQKDFIDSKLWLSTPWGKWVSASSGRRLVLGLPMLEDANSGQFSEGVSGNFDLYFKNLALELVSQKLDDTIIRLGYEANCNTIGPWQATDNPAGYKLLFRHIVAVMKAVPGSNFKFDWTVCNGLQNGKPLDSYASFYPGSDVVDIIGVDVYDVKWGDTSITPEQRWEYIMNRKMGVNELFAFASSQGKPVSIPEWGLYKPGDSFSGGGDDPYFIYKMTDLINKIAPVYYSYFNVNWGGGVLHDFPNSESAYKLIFGN